MYKGKKVIDVHGHISTPPHFRAAAMNLIALRTAAESAAMPEAAVKQALDRHLRLLDERNVDVQLISARPVAMLHWERTYLVESWTEITNKVIFDQTKMHPDRFVGIGQLPQSPQMNIKGCVKTLQKCVEEYKFVGATLNPDPGGDRQAPGLDDEAWFPLYEKAEELQATLVVHPSISRDPRLDRIPHSYQYNNMTEETLATLLLEHGDVFQRFPKLKILICHCGGCLRRLMEAGDIVDATKPRGADNVIGLTGEHGGGQATGKAQAVEVPPPSGPDLSENLFFDTCSYDPFYLATAIRQRGPNRMAFGTEAPGSGSAQRNPITGKPADDILATIDSFDFLSEAQKIQMVHTNPLKFFPLLAKHAL
jgi:predicted TIM-barrel fold metal-dependent hydrolase